MATMQRLDCSPQHGLAVTTITWLHLLCSRQHKTLNVNQAVSCSQHTWRHVLGLD